MKIRPSKIIEAYDDYVVVEDDSGNVFCLEYTDIEWLIIDEVDKIATETWGLV